MFKRFVLINCPGIGVGDLRNTSASQHSLEKLLKYSYEQNLQLDLSALESIGLEAFVKYEGSLARKSSVTARLASRNVYGEDDFSALSELGGGDEQHFPVWSTFTEMGIEGNDDIFLISIGADESIVPAYEFIETDSDGSAREDLIDVLSAPLTRNECVVVTLSDFREAALEGNQTFAAACLAHLSKIVKDALPLIGSTDALMVVSTTAIDVAEGTQGFRNELTPMMYHTPLGQTHDLGLRLLSDIGPSIAEFFNRDRSELIGASMGKWMAPSEEMLDDPTTIGDSQIHS